MNDYYNERYDPYFDPSSDTMIKLEHLGRYLFAVDFLRDKKPALTLDVCSGVGYGAALLSEISDKVVGIDKDDYFVKNKYRRDNIKFDVINLDEDKYPYKEVDAICCFETLEHLEHPHIVLSDFYKSLKDGGYLIFSIPNKRFEVLNELGINKDVYHKHIFNLNDLLAEVKSNNFEVLEILGQSVSNKIVLANPNLNLNINDDDDLLKYTKEFAYPNSIDIDDSYSFIVVCKK